MNKALQELTDDTLKEIKKLDIVLPEVYTDIFYAKAREKDIKINQKDKEQAMLYALERIEKVSDEAHRSTKELHLHVTNAKSAVHDRDENALDSIENHLAEMEKRVLQLQKEIYQDNLTNLYNRRWLFEKFLKNEHFTNSGVFAFIDINKFKNINDNFGHSTGDKVLQIIAKVLKKIKSTIALRYAGDEFIIISTTLTKEKLEKLLQVVYNNIKETELKTQNETFSISFSYGIASFKANDPFKKIYQKADKLMYEHKKMLSKK